MSNKTPSDNLAKTASVLRRSVFILILLGIGAAGIVVTNKTSSDCHSDPQLPVKTIKTDAREFTAEIAETDEHKARGLSGRACLAADQAMLFKYDQPGNYCYWMKEMHFAIDMVWLDENKQVVTIKSDVKPATYPESFCPDKPAQYVVEVNAGVAKTHGWQASTQFSF